MHKVAIESLGAYLGFGDAQVFGIARSRHEIEVGEAQSNGRFLGSHMIDETGVVHMQMRQEKRHARLIDAELVDGRIEQSGAFGRRRPRIDGQAFAPVANKVAIRL